MINKIYYFNARNKREFWYIILYLLLKINKLDKKVTFEKKIYLKGNCNNQYKIKFK